MLYKFWRIFPGVFLEDFSGHFSHKTRRTNPARKSTKKYGGSKIKIRKKIVLPKAGPKKWAILTRFRLRFGLFGPPLLRGSGNSFQTLFATLGLKGPNDPCSRARQSQLLWLEHLHVLNRPMEASKVQTGTVPVTGTVVQMLSAPVIANRRSLAIIAHTWGIARNFRRKNAFKPGDRTR